MSAHLALMAKEGPETNLRFEPSSMAVDGSRAIVSNVLNNL
jgi:hypothetical protein